MKPLQSVRRLEKLIAYALGRRPDEFGLVPAADGWVKLKELLKAITEEEGWRHVRRSQIEEIVLTQPEPEIEIHANHVRARRRDLLPAPRSAEHPPKLLYTCVRRRAHFVVMDRGVGAVDGESVVLAVTAKLAQRIGRRRDPHPVLLTVNVEQALARSIALHRLGELIYLADFIPPGCFTAPPLPKEKPTDLKPAAAEKGRDPKAGTFALDTSRFETENRKDGATRKRREKEWTKERRQQRKHKQKW
jgi:putative RNA 2'-phosphotransferase